MIYIKFILNDYNYETNIKSHLKKIFGGVTECLINIFDIFWIKHINLNEYLQSHKEFMEKLNKLIKLHKLNFKTNKADLIISQLGKNIESVSTVIKRFSE
jgi:hypothetical protein